MSDSEDYDAWDITNETTFKWGPGSLDKGGTKKKRRKLDDEENVQKNNNDDGNNEKTYTTKVNY